MSRGSSAARQVASRTGHCRPLLWIVSLGLLLAVAGQPRARTSTVRADQAGDQAYLDQLGVALAEAQANLEDVQFYLPLASHNDQYDPTWQIVRAAADGLGSDADTLTLITAPDSYAAAHAALQQALHAASAGANHAIDAYTYGDELTGDRALIEFNDALVSLLQTRSRLPGGPTQQNPPVAERQAPELSVSAGDGSSAARPLALGATLTTRAGWQVSITHTDFDAWPLLQQANRFNAPPNRRDRAVLVTLSVTNVGALGASIRYADFALTSNSGRLYLPFSPDVSCGNVPAQLDTTLAAGSATQGSVCFQIPAAEQGLLLVTHYQLDPSDARYLALQ